MSTVTGRFILKPEPTTTNYYYYTVGSGFFSSQGFEEGNSEALYLLIFTTYYYTMLQQLLLHCYYIHVIELLAILFLCFKTRRKMLVFDRPSFSSLFRFLPCSPLYTASPFHLIQMHKCLVADVRLAGMLDTHPCFISPFMFCLIGRCSRRSSPGAGVPRRRLLLRRAPR